MWIANAAMAKRNGVREGEQILRSAQDDKGGAQDDKGRL